MADSAADEIVRGSGDFFRDMGYRRTHVMRLRFSLANRIGLAIEDRGRTPAYPPGQHWPPADNEPGAAYQELSSLAYWPSCRPLSSSCALNKQFVSIAY